MVQVARVPAGDVLSEGQRTALARSVASAELATGLLFLVHVGPLDGGRESAEAILRAQGDAAQSMVVVAVDPPSHDLQIVTGPRAATQIDDRACALAALAMTSSFAAGDLVGGLRNGLQVLADHGREVTAIHLDGV